MMCSLKSPCATSYRSSIDTTALHCLVFEKITFFCILATDRQTNRWTKRWSRSLAITSCGLISYLQCKHVRHHSWEWELQVSNAVNQNHVTEVSSTVVCSTPAAQQSEMCTVNVMHCNAITYDMIRYCVFNVQ